jgi:hypothetical protein
MTHLDPKEPKTPNPHCGVPNVSPRAARVSFVFALVAFAGGTACIMCGHWPPGLILVFAGVAGTMASVQVWQH